MIWPVSILSQFVKDPTHVKGNILDLVLTNLEKIINNLFVFFLQLIFCDHFFLSFAVDHTTVTSSKQTPKSVFDYCHTNFEGICNNLLDIDLFQCLNSNDMNMFGPSLNPQ